MTQHQVVVNKRVRGEPSGIHLVLEIHGTVELVVVNKALDENAVGGGRRVNRSIIKELLEMLEGSVRLAAIEIGLEDEVVGYDIWNDAGLCDETVEGEEIGVTGLAEEGVENGVNGENGGAAIGVNGVASVECGFIEVVFADKGEDAVVKVQPVAGKGGGVFGKLRVVRVEVVGWGLGLGIGIGGLWLGAVQSGERGFDAELALAAAAFRGGFFRGGEGEEAEADGGGLSEMLVRVGHGSKVSEEGGFGESHAMLWGLFESLRRVDFR